MATTFEQTAAEEALTLEERVAASCGLSLAEAEKEIDCAADNLRAGIEDDSLNYDNVLDEYIEMLERHRAELALCGRVIPDLVWETFLSFLEECGGETGSANISPSNVVDNMAVNGDYGSFDDYKRDGETDKQFVARMKDDCVCIFPKKRFIIISFGL